MKSCDPFLPRWRFDHVGVVLALAAQPAGGRGGAQQAPAQPMSFFVTSVGKNDGANYGGLAGADAHCRRWPRRPAVATSNGSRT